MNIINLTLLVFALSFSACGRKNENPKSPNKDFWIYVENQTGSFTYIHDLGRNGFLLCTHRGGVAHVNVPLDSTDIPKYLGQ
jgi:hypothetical protein